MLQKTAGTRAATSRVSTQGVAAGDGSSSRVSDTAGRARLGLEHLHDALTRPPERSTASPGTLPPIRAGTRHLLGADAATRL